MLNTRARHNFLETGENPGAASGPGADSLLYESKRDNADVRPEKLETSYRYHSGRSWQPACSLKPVVRSARAFRFELAEPG